MVLVTSSICSTLRHDWEGRRDGGAKSQPAEGAIESAGEGGHANEEDVGNEELDVCADEGEGKSMPVSD